MDLDKAVDIFGACFAVAVLRMLRKAKRHGGEEPAARDESGPSHGSG